MKKLLALILASVMILCLAGCGNKDGDSEITDNNDNTNVSSDIYNDTLTYAPNEDGDLEITGFLVKGNDLVDVVIPASIDGRDVTGIGDAAFKACVTVRSITFEGDILYIGNAAFYGCTALKSITLPATVEVIEPNAFRASGLESITLSASLKTISLAAFWDCTALKSISFPASVETIGDGAFWNCKALTSVDIPETVKTIGDTAFYGCTALTAASYYASSEIGESVFDNCAEAIVVTVK
jgi:predicted small lipoprotein YifL